jgi:hypothetical protein
MVAVCCVYLLARHHSERADHLASCEQLLPLFRGYTFGAAAILATISVVMAKLGYRAWRAGQYPPPGTNVFFRTRVWTGWWARLNSLSLMFSALVAAYFLVQLAKFVFTSDLGPLLFGLQGCEA